MTSDGEKHLPGRRRRPDRGSPHPSGGPEGWRSRAVRGTLTTHDRGSTDRGVRRGRDRAGAPERSTPRARPPGARVRRLARALRPVAREPTSDVERGGARRRSSDACHRPGVEGGHGDPGGSGRRREPEPHFARGDRRICDRAHRPAHPRRRTAGTRGPPDRDRPHGGRGRVRRGRGKNRRSRIGRRAGVEDRAHRPIGVPIRRGILVPPGLGARAPASTAARNGRCRRSTRAC